LIAIVEKKINDSGVEYKRIIVYMIKQARVLFCWLCLTILAGCNVSIFSTPDNFPEPTHIYETVSAGLTATARATESITLTPPAIKTPNPGVTSLIARTTPVVYASETSPARTQGVLPCNRASAGKPSIDVTIPDGMTLKPGQPFSKTWRVTNSGSCTWTSDYALVWFSGESFSSVQKQNFAFEVPGGQSIDITIDMVAPDQAGVHQSNWKFVAPNGSFFGLGPAGDAPFWVRIVVEALSTPGTEGAAGSTQTPAVAMIDTVILGSNQGIDLDVGTINAGASDDIGIAGNVNGVPSLMPLNGARAALFGFREPAETDCRVATLSSEGIVLSTIPENSYFCFRTNMGLPGFGRLSNVTNQSLTLIYTTWMVP
jgi:hypothetical protein